MTEEERRYEEYLRRRKKRMIERRRQVRRQKIMLGGILLLLLIVVAISVSVRSCQSRAAEAEKQQEAAKAAAQQEEENNTLHLLAVGDNYYHDAILAQGEAAEWNFDSIYENVKDEIGQADLAVVNQEVPLVSDPADASGYPKFGTPLAGGEALVSAGFDVVTMATNHSYDKGSAGIADTLTFWREQHPEITVLGIHDSQEDQDANRVRIVEKKNFKIAMINYTSLINEDAQVPDDESYAVDVYSEEAVQKDVAAAKEQADLVMVFLHTGVEDQNEIDDQTQERINYLAQQGVDIAICSHPHVLRPVSQLDRPDGGKMLVYYSLGNFVSAQKEVPQLLEGMADITLKKDADTGEVTIQDYSLVPLVMHYEKDQTNARVYLLDDYTEELAAAHGVHDYSSDEFTLESIRQYFSTYTDTEGESTS